MIFGNLSDAFEHEKTIMEAVENNLRSQGTNATKKPTKVSKILTSLSHYGMDYADTIYNNMWAIPADKNLQQKEDAMLTQALFGQSLKNWIPKKDEEKTFVEKSLNQKIEILRKMSIQPELEDILDIMSNECIVYDDDESYIANPFLDTSLLQTLNEKSAEEIRNAVNSIYYKLYLLLNWKRTAWDDFKRFLIEGVLAYEILYDDIENPKRGIIGFTVLDPSTLTKTIENGIIFWYQFKGILGKERKLIDAQIIYIKYEESGFRQSYLERLIRPFNLYRIIEQAQIIWTVTQSSFKTLFTIPVNGLNRAKGWQVLSQQMNRYKEDITFNVDTAELKVNGKVNMPFNKEYWMPENENGRPEIETLVDQGPQLNDNEQLKFFEQKLIKMSKIPYNRFDSENQAGWFGTDPSQVMRDEINFSRFVTKLRNTFAEIMLKPLRIQLAIQLPDLKNDKRILDAITLQFNSYNQFTEMMEMEVMTKRIEFIGTMKDSLVLTDKEGNETPFFNPRFLIVKYLKMSDADLELNDKFNLEDAKKNKKEGGDKEGGGDEEGGVDDDLMGGDESESDNDQSLDSEMLGDVQPESSETTQA